MAGNERVSAVVSTMGSAAMDTRRMDGKMLGGDREANGSQCMHETPAMTAIAWPCARDGQLDLSLLLSHNGRKARLNSSRRRPMSIFVPRKN